MGIQPLVRVGIQYSRFLDSSILQLIGAGGLGFLITEVTSLCQWGRLSTVLLVVIVLVAIIGANGAQKSTFLRVLTGLVPCSGTVSVLKHTVSPALGVAGFRQLRAHVAQVMQCVHLVARLSALDNELIGCLARTPGWRSCLRWHTAEDQALARAALQSLGLLAQADVRADQLSGGERQKVALVPVLAERVIGLQADQIIFDIPSPMLDTERLEQLYRSTAGCAQEHAT